MPQIISYKTMRVIIIIMPFLWDDRWVNILMAAYMGSAFYLLGYKLSAKHFVSKDKDYLIDNVFAFKQGVP